MPRVCVRGTILKKHAFYLIFYLQTSHVKILISINYSTNARDVNNNGFALILIYSFIIRKETFN
jgi:hypothetical protein